MRVCICEYVGVGIKEGVFVCADVYMSVFDYKNACVSHRGKWLHAIVNRGDAQ